MDSIAQFDLADTRFSFLRVDSGYCSMMGQVAIFAGTPDAPHTQLLLANGYGERMGEGLGGECERENIIEKALKGAGYEGQLSGAEFLAVLILVGFGTEMPMAEFAQGGEDENPATPIFNQACKLVAPEGSQTSYHV